MAIYVECLRRNFPKSPIFQGAPTFGFTRGSLRRSRVASLASRFPAVTSVRLDRLGLLPRIRSRCDRLSLGRGPGRGEPKSESAFRHVSGRSIRREARRRFANVGRAESPAGRGVEEGRRPQGRFASSGHFQAPARQLTSQASRRSVGQSLARPGSNMKRPTRLALDN